MIQQVEQSHLNRAWLPKSLTEPEIDLLVVVSIALVTVPVSILTSGLLRAIFGVTFVLFLPGYAIAATAFPSRDQLTALERIALSFGLSFAAALLIGLGLTFTPWGIQLLPALLSLASFTVATSAIAYYRRRRRPSGERYPLPLYLPSLPLTSGRSEWAAFQSALLPIHILARAVMVALVLAVVVLIVWEAKEITNYLQTRSIGRDDFTEFYVLGSDGKAESSPREVALGAESVVRLRVVNHEHQPSVYRVVITDDGQTVRQIGPIRLGQGETWEEDAGFKATKAGPEQPVEILLFRDGQAEPYEFLHLWLNVR